MRASDRARDRATAALSRAAAEGRLSLDTLSWRLDDALSARDVALLDHLVSDLPWWRRPPGTRARELWHWLTAVDDDEPPPVMVLPKDADVAVIGRGSACDVRYADRSVSRRHAQLRRDGGGWRVVDLLSTNGTYLNGRLVSSAVAYPGDELAFGTVRVFLPR